MPEYMKIKFHYLVRGILFADGKILLAHQTGAGNTFLPGGHIANGEKAEIALTREIEEEIGKKATVKGFVGAVEHGWTENNQYNHEINLVFEIAVPGLDSSKPPQSLEGHLEFIWSEPTNLKRYNLQPYPLIECLINWKSGYNSYWGTSLQERP
jgi:8-oxo-dGTP pyrophosphatase MutT (NUDIX family)